VSTSSRARDRVTQAALLVRAVVLVVAAAGLVGVAGTGASAAVGSPVTAIAAGGGYSCALAADATVSCWGDNSAGQLGNATTTSSATPVTVVGLSGVTAIAVGYLHACALTGDGTVHCWGSNASGQLGNGTTTDSATPVTVVGLSGVTAIAAGVNHSCALTAAGAVRCWGGDLNGQLGNGTTPGVDSATPVPVVGLSGVTAITAGGNHTCALRVDATVRCWGDNTYGDLGSGAAMSSSTPVAVVGLTGVTAITAGWDHTCALLVDATMRCWGDNTNGQLANSYRYYSVTPLPVVGLSGVASISAGNLDTCAVTRGGTGYCWGANFYGELGNGTTSQANQVPGVVSGLAGVTAITAGNYHSCALTAAHTVHCWGWNASGQLGDGTTTNRTTAVATLGLTSRVWDRLGGADRYATAAAVSRSAFPTGGAGAVVLARGDAYPDALVGVPLAAARHAPLLLTHGTTLPPATLTEIRRVLPVGGTVYLLGGTDVVPASIGTQLTTLGYQTTRYAGTDRFGTAVAVADALGDPSTVLLASGLDFPDALAAGPAATAVHGVVLLTAGSKLPPVTAAYLAAHPGTVYAIGGPAAAADPTAQPVLGADRYGTAATVAATFFPTPTTVGIATGLNFPDALAGAAQLATAGGPLLLTTTSVLPAVSGSALTAAKASITTTHYYGQTDVVADPVALTAAASLGY
jgi:alpha-tubulin suppressor-like RCC1 family protein/putative cell wall-binding protein